MPVIVTAAITGAIHTPTMSPHLPFTIEDVARQAIDAAKAGAAVVHIHARNPENGLPTSDRGVFRRILERIKAESDAVICITTGGGTGMNVEERVAVVVGLVYFLLFLISSITSRSAGRFAKRYNNLARPINSTFVLGGILILLAGLSVHYVWYMIAIAAFVGLYIMQNIRKPLNVAYISDTIDSKVMASGLSVEAQMVTIFTAFFAPLIGWLADVYGIGISLFIAGIVYLAIMPLAAVRKVE